MPPAAIAQRRFVPWKFIQFHLTDWLSAVAHVRPSQNTQKRCATPTHPVYDRFSATPTGQIPLFSKRFSLSTRATAYGTLSPLLPALKLQIWTLPSSFSALLTFRVYLRMSLERRLFKSTDVLQHPPAPFPRQIFVELMEMAASSVEFSFNDIMHRQIDGLAMGSPLGPALDNIFVGYHESELFQTNSKPEVYYRYMDDTFVVFSNEDKCDLFL